jgi:hypothetical protein
VRRFSLAVGLAIAIVGAIVACGGNGTTLDFSGPILACRSIASAACTRLSQCPGENVDINSCTQLLESPTGQNCNAAGCSIGTTYSAPAAQTCYNDTLGQDCNDATANVTPPSCSLQHICPPNPTDAGTPDGGPDGGT